MRKGQTGDGQIISLFGGSDGGSNCFTEIEAYWSGLCNGRIMPDRSDVDPRGIVGALERTFLIERVAPGVARFRLAGMHLSDLMGMEVRGMPLSCFFLPAARDEIAEAVESVFSDPARVDLWLAGPAGAMRRGGGVARMLILPLRDDHGEVTRALGCLSASGLRGSAPHRFTITTDSRQTLIGFGKRSEGTRDGIRAVPSPAAAAKDPPTRPEARRPRLTIVSNRP